MVFRTFFQLASPAGSRSRLSVLIFHRVLPELDPLFPNEMHARRFDATCGWLARWFNVLPLDLATQQLREGRLPARAACITFDDGYADNCAVAMPILQRHGLTASFFIATGFLDGGRMWNDSIIESIRQCQLDTLDLNSLGLGLDACSLATIEARQRAIATLLDQIKYRPAAERLKIVGKLAHQARVQLPDDLMLTSDAVRTMRLAGMQIGAHTVTHPILARADDADAEREIVASRKTLESLLQEPVTLFAYPNGKPGQDYCDRHVQMVRRVGFETAVSTAPGVSTTATDVLQMPRFTPWDSTRLRYAARLLVNLRRVESDVT